MFILFQDLVLKKCNHDTWNQLHYLQDSLIKNTVPNSNAQNKHFMLYYLWWFRFADMGIKGIRRILNSFYLMYNVFLILLKIIHMRGRRDSAVCIATGYKLGDRRAWVWVLAGLTIFSSPCRSERFWGPEVKQSGYEAGHSPSTSAVVMKMWIHTPIPHMSS
jgi:hypothetical protein